MAVRKSILETWNWFESSTCLFYFCQSYNVMCQSYADFSNQSASILMQVDFHTVWEWTETSGSIKGGETLKGIGQHFGNLAWFSLMVMC